MPTAIRRLSDRIRELVRAGELDNAEIASVLKCPINTVKIVKERMRGPQRDATLRPRIEALEAEVKLLRRLVSSVIDEIRARPRPPLL
jgi:hypothetical protein